MYFDEHLDIPLYLQVASNIENLIFTRVYQKDDQVMSTTEILNLYRINPATVLKGMNLLVDRKILYKKRGMGLFVSGDAYDIILKHREESFEKNFIEPLVQEVKKLNMDLEILLNLIRKEF